MTVRLEWDGKPERVERVHLPFQTVETINESRATRERDTGALFGGVDPQISERNLLIWGDNKLVMSSLLQDYAGQIKLIYIDPPFATGDDFVIRLQLGDSALVKEPSILEEHAYRDTWGSGYPSYLSMMYERLVLIHELLADDGTLYVHCDWHVNSYLRLVLDEIFGTDRFMAEIVWKRTIGATSIADRYRTQTDSILVYTKTESYIFNEQFTKDKLSQDEIEEKFPLIDPERGRYCTDNLANPDVRPTLTYEYNGYKPPAKGWAISLPKMEQWDAEGRLHFPKDKSHRIRRKRFLSEWPGAPIQNLWDDISPLQSQARERTGYATQKPEALAERIIKASSNEGDLVFDCFVGSGTTAAVAEKLGRRWIACDLGRFAIHTTRKRLLNIPDCRPFDIQNLGAYERQRWQIESGNGALRAYLDTILAFYNAEPAEGFIHLHGRKADRMVHVGATDAPVTIDETEDVIDEMADNGIEACDLLGWEWEMGLHDTISERARRRGLDLRPRQIPREVMERQVSEADVVRFFELAFVDLDVRRKGHEACVVLKDFAIPSEDLIPQKVRESIASWSDLIDYWSVDFDFSDEVFHNQWQAYRTRENPALATQSDWHEYPKAGRYAIVVKIIDIFGNDTTKLAEVRIK
jgi:adenine-specific DNA-methyltransferase